MRKRCVCPGESSTFQQYKIVFLFVVKAQNLIRQHAACPDVQAIRFKSFDLATSTYQETCQMIDAVEEEVCPGVNTPVHMLVNCAGMAICGKCSKRQPILRGLTGESFQLPVFRHNRRNVH